MPKTLNINAHSPSAFSSGKLNGSLVEPDVESDFRRFDEHIANHF